MTAADPIYVAAYAEAFCSALRNAMLDDLAERMGCAEAEATAALYRILGWDGDLILAYHAYGNDDPECPHHALNANPEGTDR